MQITAVSGFIEQVDVYMIKGIPKHNYHPSNTCQQVNLYKFILSSSELDNCHWYLLASRQVSASLMDCERVDCVFDFFNHLFNGA